MRRLLQRPAAVGEPHQPGPLVGRVGFAAHVAAPLEVSDQFVHRLLGHHRPVGQLRHPQPVDRTSAQHLDVRGPQIGVVGKHLVAHGVERPVRGRPQQAGDPDRLVG